ncbi:MAG: nickel pincer cofactor biosynthesis protein LarC [Anaeromyxobacter sp.]|nr:nickel pincer cofactor biosynthesis protein LarC [Anaeromyxobacter sp.]
MAAATPPSLLVLEPIGGIAGDMFLAAALDAGVDRAALEAALATLGLPGWRLEVTRRSVSGISATHVEVVVTGEQPGSRRRSQILDLIQRSGLSPRARATACALFERVGRAEATVHGVPLEEVHFHEVGAVDSVVDLCGAVVVLELLGWPRVVSAPPELGRGLTRTAHGPMPVPPPAVLELLTGVPIRPGGPPGEAVTPTGAALLAHFAAVGPLPAHVPLRVGYGAGTVTWPDRPNLLRLTLAEPAALAAASPGAGPAEDPEGLYVVETTLDDCPGQLVARAMEVLLELGALDAWAAPITMKKGRPGVLLSALCDGAHRAAAARALLTETTTLGVRWHRVERQVAGREWHEVETGHGPVRVKVALLDGREVGAHPEYEDCLARARAAGVPVREVQAAALAAWRARAGRAPATIPPGSAT